jgi:hypothetical protein
MTINEPILLLKNVKQYFLESYEQTKKQHNNILQSKKNLEKIKILLKNAIADYNKICNK